MSRRTRLQSRLARALAFRRDRLTAAAATVRHPRRTALAIPVDRRPPVPSAFEAFGRDSWVVPPIRLSGVERIRIGDRVQILEDGGIDVGEHARLTIADGVVLGPGVEITCASSITIGERASASDRVAITDTWGGVDPRPDDPVGAPVVIGAGAYLGCGSSVGPGVTVGERAYVGEGSVVVDDVPANTVVRGNPARIVARFDPATGGWVEVARA